MLVPKGANSTDNTVRVNLNPPQAAGDGGGVTINHNKNTAREDQANVLKISGNWTGDYSRPGGSQTAYNAYALVQADITGATTSADKPITGFGVGTSTTAGKHWCAFRSTGLVAGQTPGALFVGFQSQVQEDAATEAYNFYATGTAPNYFEGYTELKNGVARLQAISGSKIILGAHIPYGATNATGNNLVAFQFAGQDLKGGQLDTLSAFTANNVGQAAVNYGFYAGTNISSSGKTNYNFYAAGTAPNYFNGKVGIGNTDPSEMLVIEAPNDPKIRFVDTGNYEYKLGITDNNRFSLRRSSGNTNTIQVNPSGNIDLFGQVNLPGGGAGKQAITVEEVDAKILGLAPGVPGVGDITEVIAGNGLTGGGSLGNITLHAGQGSGIDVTADAIAVDGTVVRTSGTQTITGPKSFTDPISIPGGVNANHALRKSQIDNLIGGATSYKNVKAYGAVGDGTTDDTTAIQTALNSEGVIFFPKGRYKVTNTIVLANKSVKLQGAGRGSVILFEPATANTDCLVLRYNTGAHDDNQNYAIADLSILCPAGVRAGTGVTLQYTGAVAVIGADNALTLNNIKIGSEHVPDASIGYFKTGLKLQNSSGVVGNNVTIACHSKFTVSYGDVNSVAIDIINDMGHNMIRTLNLTNVYLQRYHKALRCRKTASSGNIESLYISHGEILGAKGFDIEKADANYFSGLHFDVRDYAFKLDPGCNITRIVGNDIRAGRDEAGNDPVDGVDGDWLLQLRGNGAVVTGNDILSFMPRRGAIVTGGESTNPENITITGNWISGNGQTGYLAIKADNGSQNVTFGGNTLSQFGGNNSPFATDVGTELFIYGQRDGNSTTFDASDLLARIATLEADHATMMNNNSGGSY